MENDWDLYAVVKGYTAVASATAATTSVNNSDMAPAVDPFLSSSSMVFLNDESSFDEFRGFSAERSDGPFQGLEEFCKEICIDPAAATGIAATTTTSIPVGQVFQNHQQNPPPQEIPQIQPQLMNIQRQENQRIESPVVGTSLNFPIANPQAIRPRRRKNQQSKMVRQMTQEELSADSWAWRKYGQKPIKGSPYPRNYYRCSTSKGCAARKHVERSPIDPAIFVVSYTGEHTHPRPTQRSSLAGSTRTKFSPATTSSVPTTNSSNPMSLPNSTCSSSSLASSSSFSPNTPLVEGESPTQNDDVEMIEEEQVEVEDEDEDEDVLLANDIMSEEIFKEFQELSGTNNGSDHSSGGDIF